MPPRTTNFTNKKDMIVQYKHHDDCDWQQVYPVAHQRDMIEIEQSNQFDLPKQHQIINGKLVYEGKPLLSNHQWLYEKIYELQPQSAFEVGFGYANHLLSINRMMPNIELSGCDIAYAQFYNGAQKYPELEEFIQKYKLIIGDFININIDKKYDLVYSQAVLMHMSTERAMSALQKMCLISNKYVVCLEGGVAIPDVKNWITQFGKVTIFDDWAKENWTSEYNIGPFIIETNKI